MVYNTEALILRQWDYKEQDRMISMLTPERGKINAIAKGARKTRSKLSGSVQPLTHVNLLIYTGKGPDIIQQAEVLDSFIPLKSDLDKLAQAFNLAEIFNAMSFDGETEEHLFRFFLASLKLLQKAGSTLAAACAIKLKLLAMCGYEMQFGECSVCGCDVVSGKGYISFAHGGLVCRSCLDASGIKATRLSSTAQEFIRQLQVGKDICCPPEREMLHVMGLLDGVIQDASEKEIRSGRFLHQVMGR